MNFVFKVNGIVYRDINDFRLRCFFSRKERIIESEARIWINDNDVKNSINFVSKRLKKNEEIGVKATYSSLITAAYCDFIIAETNKIYTKLLNSVITIGGKFTYDWNDYIFTIEEKKESRYYITEVPELRYYDEDGYIRTLLLRDTKGYSLFDNNPQTIDGILNDIDHMIGLFFDYNDIDISQIYESMNWVSDGNKWYCTTDDFEIKICVEKEKE